MTKEQIAAAIMEARVACLLEPPERRKCEALRLVNAYRKGELLGMLDAAEDHKAWFDREGYNASVITTVNKIPF